LRTEGFGCKVSGVTAEATIAIARPRLRWLLRSERDEDADANSAEATVASPSGTGAEARVTTARTAETAEPRRPRGASPRTQPPPRRNLARRGRFVVDEVQAELTPRREPRQRPGQRCASAAPDTEVANIAIFEGTT